jgi:hypothetical protein
MTRVDDAYTDWQVHYETCARCRPTWTCELGAEIRRREAVRTSPHGSRGAAR